MQRSNFINLLRDSLKSTAGFLRLPQFSGSAARQDLHIGRSLSSNAAVSASQQRSNRAAAADLLPFQEVFGSGTGWANTELGSYYATSVSVYSAIKLRSDAVSRPNLRLFRQSPGGERQSVDAGHPVARLLSQVNPWTTQGDLWRATEIYLNLWGSAFWALERDDQGRREIWALRPDRVTVLPDRRQYIRGFVYQGRSGPVAYTPDEIVWLRYFNPLEEYAGLLVSESHVHHYEPRMLELKSNCTHG